MRFTHSIFVLLISLIFMHCSSAIKEDVTFQSGEVTLAGTLYLPEGEGPFPAVIFVHGSGAETRDNSNYSAEWLASIGYAALAYDKRGTGESGGDEQSYSRFSFDELAADVVAGMELLSKHQKIDPVRIGIHATSQGGWVAALATSKTDLVRFMVVRSASVSTVGEDRIFERSERLRQEGFSESDIREAQEMQVLEAKTTLGKATPDTWTHLFEKNKAKPWFERVYPGQDPYSQGLVDYREWYATIVDFDPIPYLESAEMPIYWIFGDAALDKSGPVEYSFANLAALKNSGKSYEIVQFSGQGHNIAESEYERGLFEWLSEVNNYHEFEFRSH